MSDTKPAPIHVSPPKPVCPVCGKPSYSPGGMHPQCAMGRHDAAIKAARQVAAAAERAKGQAAGG